MPLQLIYTSIREGLDIGRSGFCTAAKTQGMKRSLSSELEALSHYDFDKSSAKHIFSYKIISTGDDRYYVCSKISGCGVDYTGRTNFIAHHVVFRADELSSYGNPACFMLNWKGWCDSWLGSARELTKGEFKAFSTSKISRAAKTWACVSKEENKDFLQEAKNFCFVDVDENTYLNLLSEAFFAQENYAWNYSFTTRVQRDEGVRSYAINLGDAFALAILPSDFLKISPATFKLTQKKAELKKPSSGKSETEDFVFNAPNFQNNNVKPRVSSCDFKTKKDNLGLYAIIGSLAVSFVVGVILFLYFSRGSDVEPTQSVVITAPVPPKAIAVTSPPLYEEEEVSLDEEEILAQQELEKLQAQQRAEKEARQARQAREKAEKAEKAEEKRRQEALAKSQKEEIAPEVIVNKEDTGIQKLMSFLGVKNVSGFANVENLFIAIQNPDKKNYSFFNTSDFIRENTLDRKIFNHEKVEILSASLLGEIGQMGQTQVTFSPKGDLRLKSHSIENILYSALTPSDNMFLPSNLILNLKVKENNKHYSVFFTDTKEFVLNVGFEEFYDMKTFRPKKDSFELLNLLGLKAGTDYSLALRIDDNEVINKILDKNKSKTSPAGVYDKGKIEKAFTLMGTTYGDYLKASKDYNKNKKLKPKSPVEEAKKGKKFSGKFKDDKDKLVLNVVYGEFKDDSMGFYMSAKGSLLSRYQDVFANARGQDSIKNKTLFSKEMAMLEEMKGDSFYDDIFNFYPTRGKEEVASAQEAHWGRNKQSFTKDFKALANTLSNKLSALNNSFYKDLDEMNKILAAKNPDYKDLENLYKTMEKYISDFYSAYYYEINKFKNSNKYIDANKRNQGDFGLTKFVFAKFFGMNFYENGKMPKVNINLKAFKFNIPLIFRHEVFVEILEEENRRKFNEGIEDRYAIAMKKYDNALKAWEDKDVELKNSIDKAEGTLTKDYFSQEQIGNSLFMKNFESGNLTNLLNQAKIYIKFNIK